MANFKVLGHHSSIRDIASQWRMSVPSSWTKKISHDPHSLFQAILLWTGGHPFLTQYLLSLSVKFLNNKPQNVSNIVYDLVERRVFQNWRNQTELVKHFQTIGNDYIKEDSQEAKLKFSALENYKQILMSSKATRFFERSLTQRELLTSGLVIKTGEVIDVANPIYRKVFDINWIIEVKKQIHLRSMIMNSNLSIYNRDFFFLVSKSGSMTYNMSERDRRVRYEVIQDTVRGNVFQILKYSQGEEPNLKKICNNVTLAFFNVKEKVSKSIYNINEHLEIDNKFRTNQPGGDAFIAPTFEYLINKWFEQREEGRGACFVIYVDAKIDDYERFANAIEKICQKLENHYELKILIVGVGDSVKNEKTVHQFMSLDLNGYGFTDKYGNLCDVVIFERKDELDESGIVQCISQQLVETPEKEIPEWFKEEYFNLYQEFKQKYHLE